VELEYGRQQVVAGIVFAVLVLLIVAFLVVVWRNTRRDLPLERVQGVGYAFRKRWLAFLAAALVVAVGSAALLAPYPGGAAGERTVVKVASGQFFFTFDPPRVPAGTRVRFEITSVDVNHGVGLYSPGGRLMASVQAMPGYANKLDLTLREPGRYPVLCLEYCGLNHHLMQGAFEVTPS
jgi:cytochrome c oxidase subunit 2